MKRFQIGGLEVSGRRFLRAERVEAVTGVAEQRAAHGQAGALEQIILLRVDAGDLHFAFAFQFAGRENRVQQDIGDQIEAGCEIAAQHFRVDAEAVVAAVAVNAAADGFNFRRDLVGGARLVPLSSILASNWVMPLFSGGFGEHAALERRAKFDKGQAMTPPCDFPFSAFNLDITVSLQLAWASPCSSPAKSALDLGKSSLAWVRREWKAEVMIAIFRALFAQMYRFSTLVRDLSRNHASEVLTFPHKHFTRAPSLRYNFLRALIVGSCSPEIYCSQI